MSSALEKRKKRTCSFCIAHSARISFSWESPTSSTNSAILPHQRPDVDEIPMKAVREYKGSTPDAVYEHPVSGHTKPAQETPASKPWKLDEVIAATVKTCGSNIQEIWVTDVPQGTMKLDLSTGPVYGYVKHSGTDVFQLGPKNKNLTNVLVWPPPTDNPKRAKNKENTLGQLPPEILYKIASRLDDVGFVCLRNTCTRLRASLAIETTIEFTPVQRYLLRGLYSLNGVMNPTKFFCATCTERSFYSYPDQRPAIATLRGWRNKNVHDGRRARVVRCACGGWCEVGSISAETKGEKQKRLKQLRREGGEFSLLHDPISSPRQNVSEAGLMRIGRGREQ